MICRRHKERILYNEKCIRKAIGPRVKRKSTGVKVINGKAEVFHKSLHRSRSGVRFRLLVRVIRVCKGSRVSSFKSFIKETKTA